MGQLVSRQFSSAAGSVAEIIGGRKRKREEEASSSSDEQIFEESMRTPKRKKLLTTTQYIYQTLFKDEQSSDIDVYALGKVWHLHKIYLCQSPYFASMFNGHWREATEDCVRIEITDPKITIDSLYVVFGSLYIDEVILEPKDIVSILATATLFHLTGLIEKCSEVMCETTHAETVISYYEAACDYGVQTVKSAAFKWLLVNLLSFINKHSKYLRDIDVELMQALVSSPDLCVMQTEFSLYMMLRTWMLLKLYPDWDPEDKQLQPETYFSRRQDQTAFLLTTQGQMFEPSFQGLRIHSLILHNIDINTLKQDNIIPISWLYEPLYEHWVHMLQVDQTIDKGPKEVDEAVFYRNCIRCGRVLQEEDFQKWRWTGFNFGLDLVLITDTRTLSIKRHHRAENERLLSLQVKRQFLIKVTLTSLNEFRQVKHSQSTEIKSLTLDKNEESMLLTMDRELTYPLLISVNLLVVTPNRPPSAISSHSMTQDNTSTLKKISKSTSES